MSFVTPEILAKLGKLGRADADRATFGVVQVDPAGRILLCNACAARLLGRSAEDLEGKNFFLHAAPCARNKIFQGRFEKGIAAGELNAGFSYAWVGDSRATLMQVHLLRDRFSKTQWIFFHEASESIGAEQEMRASLEDQLRAMYQERFGRELLESRETVQPAPPTDELSALRLEKEALAAELRAIKTKARNIGAAMFEAALFGVDARRRKAAGD